MVQKKDFIRILADIQGSEHFRLPDDYSCPYRGLEAFGEADADLYFGRDAVAALLHSKVDRRSLVAITGPSGSGKSSLVAAGLIPALRASGVNWIIAHCRPGTSPLTSLAMAASRLLDPAAPPLENTPKVLKVAGAIENGTLHDLFAQLNMSGARRLLFVDQFEELFTLCQNNRQRIAVLNSLLPPKSGDLNNSLRVVLTLRADFINRVFSHRQFTDALQDADVKIGPMTPEELRKVIEGPARARNVLFEEGLVDRIVRDVGSEAGTLPLLEFALTRLWQHRVREMLTHSAYERVGELAGAIANSAESMFRSMDEQEQKLTRRILSRLVRVSDDGGEDTRQRQLLSFLNNEAQIDSDVGRKSLEILVNNRLVVLGRDDVTRQETVELTHEALIRRWPRLRQWLQEDHELLVWRQRIDLVIREWKQAGRDPAFLLRGIPLNEAQIWATRRKDDLTRLEQEFIIASRTFHEREARDKPIATSEVLLRNDLAKSGLSISGETLAGSFATVLKGELPQSVWRLRLSLIRQLDMPVRLGFPELSFSQLAPILSIPSSQAQVSSLDRWTPPDLLQGIKLDEKSMSLVRALQKQAKTGAAVELLAPNLDKIKDSHLRLAYASVLFDMLHIRGRYEDAASLIEQELSIAYDSSPSDNHLLLSLRIRLIHHYMFYKPVEPLWLQMEELRSSTDPSENPSAYGEILFMLGGNLGTLRDSQAIARKYLIEAIRHSIKTSDSYLYCRCLRKYGDFLRERRHFVKAKWLLGMGLEESKQQELRHIIYYLGSLGDLARQQMEFDVAQRHFEDAMDRARESFLPGWLGNLMLGLGELMIDQGKTESALVYLEQAEAHYRQTKPQHAWGEVQIKLSRCRLFLKENSAQWRQYAEAALDSANEFGYTRDARFAERILQTCVPLDSVLMFL